MTSTVSKKKCVESVSSLNFLHEVSFLGEQIQAKKFAPVEVR